VKVGPTWGFRIFFVVTLLFLGWVVELAIFYPKVDYVGTRIVMVVLFAPVCVWFAWTLVKAHRHPLVADTTGLRGLVGVRGQQLTPSVIPWEDVDSIDVKSYPPDTQSPRYWVSVHLRDGRDGKVNTAFSTESQALSLRQSLEAVHDAARGAP
jgi:hypothetical protein